MKKKTKIIIACVLAVALIGVAVWYFGFHKKKSGEDDGSETNSTSDTIVDVADSVSEKLLSYNSESEGIGSLQRSDYRVAPAAAFRINNDLMRTLKAVPSGASIVNTGKKKR